MGKAICISGSKGGIGKTTTAINLALSLNNKGKSVILIDANFTSPNIGIYLGHPVTPKSIHEVLGNKIRIEEAMYIHRSGLKLIPGNISLSSLSNVNPDKLKNKISPLKKDYDFVIIDSAAGLGKESLSALESCDEALIILNPELPSVTDALKSIRVAQELGKEIAGVVVNRKRDKYCMTIPEIESMLEFPVIGIIPEDEFIKKAQSERDLVTNLYPKSEAAKGYEKLSSYLLGEIYQGKKEESVWDIFKEFMGLK